MKPKPFSALNHFTVPVDTYRSSFADRGPRTLQGPGVGVSSSG
jgi:hypothetical protein